MQSTAKHIRLFRQIYDCPQRSNIERCVYISVNIVSAVIAFKYLSFPIAYVVAVTTSLFYIKHQEYPYAVLYLSPLQQSLIGLALAFRQKFNFQCQLHSAKILNNFTYQKIITNFTKQFKAWQSHSSHRAFGISGFPALI